MSAADVWDLRLPDGRGLRGMDTGTILGHIRAGRLPRGTLVRRSEEEDWVGLDWVPEFAAALTEQRAAARATSNRNGRERPAPEAAPAAPAPDATATVSQRLDGARLGCPGVPRILSEVLTAFDLTLLRLKLRLVAVLGTLGGLLYLLPGLLMPDAEWIPWAQAGLGLLLLALGAAAFSQVVYVELTRHRPARWRDARRGLIGRTIRLLLALLVVPGLAIAMVAGLFWLAHNGTGLVSEEAARTGEVIAWGSAALALALAIPLVVIGPMALMLAPIFIVEECGIFGAIAQWVQILRQNLSRALLYDLLSTGVMVAFVAVPALLIGAIPWLPFDARFGTMVQIVQAILAGMLVALVLAYLVVVQVFLYLNLRFDVEQG